jgi:hypothetical protein
MRCMFEVDGESRTCTAERNDLPLYPADQVILDGHPYEIIDGPRYTADWDSSSVGAFFVVKPAPTDHF